ATVANLTATGTALKWYGTANSTTALNATDAVATGNYFVTQTLNGCESSKTQVAVTVNVTPAPTASALTFNQGATVTNLTANGTDLKWYAAANGGNELTSDTILESGSYFVSQTINGCESTRIEVVITITTIVLPEAPIALAQVFCNSATVEELVAEGQNLKWYASQDSTTVLSASDVLTTGNYYVSQSVNNVESAKTEVSVTINVTPAPIATALTFNEGATVGDLIATGTDIKWYAAANSGNALTVDTALESGSYFVSQTINGCESIRTEVVVTITTIVVPEAPTATAQVFCNSTTVADIVAEGENLKWYASLNAETALALTDAIVTGNYYVSQTVNDVESTRTEVSVTINITPAPEGEATQLFAEDGNTIANIEAEGQSIKWYATEADAIAGENELTENTILISGSTYYATQTINGCESNQVLAVTVTITLGMDDVSKFTYKYYPNPVIDKLYIETAETVTNITVYSLTGQEVINQQWNTQGGTLDVSSLEASIYLVKINFGTVEETIRMVKDKK
ncbi:T9SS type A sorting domain-containing protein, partial [Flavobacterium sp. DG1-102-2]|uniref:Ig-like domain-containing protein n=1 Tax=Flavobacterium sp. DG1-102-2 TaxID=3081663 RepID=UPI0029498556